MKYLLPFLIVFLSFNMSAQTDSKIYDIVDAVSEDRLRSDVKTLADFGTRHTLSDTLSETRGIGAARRWIKSQFDNISKGCDDCLEVFFQKDLVEKGRNQRIVKDVMVVNVVAIQRGTKYPNRFIIMSGDIDSRVSDPNDYKNKVFLEVKA